MSGKLKKAVKPALDESDDKYEPSNVDSEQEQTPVEYETKTKINALHCSSLRDLNDFLNADLKMINAKGDPTTNVTNRAEGKCYNIPERKISKFLKLLELCRRDSVRLMYAEKQQEYSGIMLDFDIYQDCEDDQLTTEIFYMLCNKIVDLLSKLLKFEKKKELIHIGITRRQKITECVEKGCYKDGFHLIIPGIKVTRGVKRLIIRKLIEHEIIDQNMIDVEPADFKHNGAKYQRKDFLDTNSAHVPVFFVGCATKKGSLPYLLEHVYEITLNTETKDVIIVKNESMLRSGLNITNEFSVNWEVTNGIIKKTNYEPQDKYAAEIQEFNSEPVDDELTRNFGTLSTNAIHDVQINELRDLLDTLNPSRAEKYETWYNVLCVLANVSSSYKDLAEYFSRKSPKYNHANFEKFWLDASRGTKRKPLTIGSLHYWAKQDNPERYEQIRKRGVYDILYGMVYEGYKEGLLSHADIAKILHNNLQYKFVTDQPEGERARYWYEFVLDDDDYIDGELYKWHRWDGFPTSLSRYISEVLPTLFDQVFKNVKKDYEKSTGDISKYYNKVLQNLKTTMRKLGDHGFKTSVIKEAEVKFSKRGFADTLDKDPLIRGVQNGVLKLTLATHAKPLLLKGHHNHAVSKFTKVPYIAFNPYDPLTKKILIALRNLFPNNEPDSFDFTMHYLSSTIDGLPKESMFMIMVGKGSNGKSFLVELHKAAIGESLSGGYGVKMPLTYITTKSYNADSATPAQMLLKDATFAYFSESDKNERLNAPRIKEITGLETLAGRRLHQNMINFKPRCHYLATTNYDFDIECNDRGTWRRIEYNPLKITFIDTSVSKIDEKDPFQRVADDTVTQQWTEDPEVQGRYLGLMVWYNYWLHRKYRGKVKHVPHPHVEFETEKYRRRQNSIAAFLAQKFIKVNDADAMFPMVEEVQKYLRWYSVNNGGVLPAKGVIEQFLESEIRTHIHVTSRGHYIKGHKFLDTSEQLSEGQDYAMKHIFDIDVPADNFGIRVEAPDDYYIRMCREYDQFKHLFDDTQVYDIDSQALADEAHGITVDVVDVKRTPIDPNELGKDVVVLSSGIVIKGRKLEEPSINLLTDSFHTDIVEMCGFLDNPVDYVNIDGLT